MNEAATTETHVAYVGLGSNIDPDANLPKAIRVLRQQTKVICASSVWKSPSLGAPGPDFLNAALKIETQLDELSFCQSVLRPLEATLGRVRTADKFAPRTIDLDVLIFDGEILDMHIWEYPHLAVPLAECAPELVNQDGRALVDIAQTLQSEAPIRKHKVFL